MAYKNTLNTAGMDIERARMTMDVRIEGYLEVVEKRLKAIQDSERADIMSEIRSRIEEKSFFEEGSTDMILDSLGDPHELALTYLGASINRSKGFSFRKALMLLSFFTAAGSSGMVVLPLLGMVSIGLIAAGIVTPIAGLMNTGNYFVNSNTMEYAAQFGPLELHPLLVFPVSLFIGVLLVMAGIMTWRLMLRFIKTIRKRDYAVIL